MQTDMNFFERLKGKPLQSMVRMALVDGEFASAEYEYLLAWAYKENIDEILLHRMLENQEESESTFGYLSIKKRFNHLYEVALLMLADHVVHPKEVEYCIYLAKRFDLSNAPCLLVRRLLDCVRAGLPPEEVYRLLKGEKLLR